MKKIISTLCAGLLLLGISAGVYAAEERNIVVKSSYYVNNEWPDLEELIHKGSWRGFTGAIAAAMFESEYPNVKIEPVQWKMWGPKAGERTRAALAAGTAPSFYSIVYSDVGGPQGMINEGMAADITDLVNKWDQKDYIAPVVWQAAWRGDRCYGIPHRLSSYLFMAYRKDWFREAGIFNSKGTPAPEDDWTWDDFQNIAKKLTNPKAEHWGVGLATVPGDGFRYVAHSFGAPMMIPDKTGKYTWKAGFNLPPTVRILEMYKNMIWKDKTAVSGTTFSEASRNPFRASRTGLSIYNLNDACGWVGLHRIEPTEKAFEELVGIAPLPRGPEGVRVPIAMEFIFGINPTQTPEEIEATFNWMTYLFAGPYTTIGMFLLEAFHPNYNVKGCSNNRIPYRLSYGAVFKDPKTHEPVTHYLDPYGGIPSDYIKTIKLVEGEPVEPVVNKYAMWEPNIIAFNTALEAAISKVCTDAKADPKTELDKAADIANKTALNVKLKGVTAENMKNYYTALGEFYQKNFPKYYQEVYKELLENYYKVW